MQRKRERREQAKQYTPDGLPRDAKDWTEQDWRDLYEATETAKRRIAARHQKGKVER